MSFRLKILLALGVVGVLPTLLFGVLSDRASRSALGETIGTLQFQTATEVARSGEGFVVGQVENLRLSVGLLPFDEVEPRRFGELLAIPFSALPALDAIVLLDAEGKALTPPMFSRSASQTSPEKGEAGLATFAKKIPLELALRTGTAIGAPYRGDDGWPRVAIAVRAAGAGAARVVAAELSLHELQARLDELGAGGDLAYLFGPEGEPFAKSPDAPEPQPAELSLRSASDGKPGRSRASELLHADGQRWLGSYAPLAGLGWGLLVEKPARVAFASADRTRALTLYGAGVALLLTGVLGVLLARGLAWPVARLSAATRQLAAGDYAVSAPVGGDDELGQLSAAFATMAAEIQRRDAEIRRWNAELSQRVERGTEELRQAQNQIVRARRLAALGSLSAGMAHELNNPLTAIMGLISVLKMDASPEQDEMLGQALDQAKRVSEIVANLKRFADQEREQGGRPFPLESAVQAVLEQFRPTLAGQGIEVALQVLPKLPMVQGDASQLREALSQLLQNAVSVMPQGGQLSVKLDAIEGDALRVTVADSGPGIPEAIKDRIFDPFFTTKGPGAGVGLGLSVAHAIVASHHGTLRVESTPGQGATFTMVLPAATSAHLV